MYIGTQFGCRNDIDIEVLAQLGVGHVDQKPTEPWMEWTTDTLKGMRDRFDKYGINLEMIHIPLSSRSAYDDEAGAVFMGPSDARDRQIDRQPATRSPVGGGGKVSVSARLVHAITVKCSRTTDI